MLEKIKRKFSITKLRQLSDPRNIGLYIFALIVLAITWSGIKTIQTNYELQKKIATLKQQNEVLKLQNENAGLQNQYLNTDQYLELAARQTLGLAAPGEKVALIPKEVAMKYVDANLAAKTEAATSPKPDNRSRYLKNFDDWRDFLLGRSASSD